jgi:hypothetical protein
MIRVTIAVGCDGVAADRKMWKNIEMQSETFRY